MKYRVKVKDAMWGHLTCFVCIQVKRWWGWSTIWSKECFYTQEKTMKQCALEAIDALNDMQKQAELIVDTLIED